MDGKFLVEWYTWNPQHDGVVAVAVQMESDPPYVWATYGRGTDIPRLPSDMLVVPRAHADRIFEYRKGTR